MTALTKNMMKYFFFSLVVLFPVILLFSIQRLRKIGPTETDRDVGRYRYFQHDSVRNESSRGFLTLPADLVEEDFPLFATGKFGTQKLSLVSKFGTEEFQCAGYCLCDEENRRRKVLTSRIGNSLGKGVFVLLSAFTLNSAYQKATDIFAERCELLHSDSCPLNSIRSGVDSCENIDHEDLDDFLHAEKTILEVDGVSNEGNDNTIEMETSYDEDEKYQVYSCQGFCVPNGRIKDANAKKIQDGINCNDYVLERDIRIEINRFQRVETKYHSSIPKYEFRMKYLVDFCKQKSLREYMNKKGQRAEAHMCVTRTSTRHENNLRCKRKMSSLPTYRKYTCSGNCLDSGRLKSEYTRNAALEFGCENLKKEGVEIILKNEELVKVFENWDLDGVKVSDHIHQLTTNKFISEHLVEYCKINSKHRYLYEKPNSKQKRWRTVTLCVASKRSNSLSYKGSKKNKSVRCLKTFPSRKFGQGDCILMGWNKKKNI